jgi:hypothetical protein
LGFFQSFSYSVFPLPVQAVALITLLGRGHADVDNDRVLRGICYGRLRVPAKPILSCATPAGATITAPVSS